MEVHKDKIDQLLCELKDGNKDAMEELVSLTYEKLMTIGISYLKSRDQAEDALQESYLAIFCRIQTYQSNLNPLGWIYQITRRKCSDILRKERAEKGGIYCLTSEEILPDYLILHLLELLEERDRQLLILRYWQNLTLREIATAMSRSTMTVQRRLNYLQDQLKLIYLEIYDTNRLLSV